MMQNEVGENYSFDALSTVNHQQDEEALAKTASRPWPL